MKINNIYGIQGAYGNYSKSKIKSPNSANALKDFKLDISQTGKDFSYALDKFKKLPEVRDEKVNKLKSEIDKGLYNVDSVKLARAMLLGETNN